MIEPSRTSFTKRVASAFLDIQKGEERTQAFFQFDTQQAREITQRVQEHQREIEHASRDDYERVLMIFTRVDAGTPPVGKSTGERVKIESVSDRSLPLIYASALAEQAIKAESVEDADNVFKKGFVVDVNVETRNAKPAAYRVTNLHQVIDLDDD